jgi:hypothetical protein
VRPASREPAGSPKILSMKQWLKMEIEGLERRSHGKTSENAFYARRTVAIGLQAIKQRLSRFVGHNQGESALLFLSRADNESLNSMWRRNICCANRVRTNYSND